MSVTTLYLQEKIEKIFRQRWMLNEDWAKYYKFLVSKGFNYDDILSNCPKNAEEEDSSHKLTNYINDYVASLL